MNLLNELIQYCEGAAKEQLMKICGVGGTINAEESKALYQKWVADDRRSVAHVLEDLNGMQNVPV